MPGGRGPPGPFGMFPEGHLPFCPNSPMGGMGGGPFGGMPGMMGIGHGAKWAAGAPVTLYPSTPYKPGPIVSGKMGGT
jgi:hypothetical protein